MLRITSQRKIILDYLRTVRTHPSAEEVYKNVRKKLPQISLSTVYRNLNLLKREGEVREITGTIKRFDGFVNNHHHFICEQCQCIFDVELNPKIKTKSKALNKVGKIHAYQIYFSGFCRFCKNQIN